MRLGNSLLLHLQAQTDVIMKLWAKSGLKMEKLLGEHLARTKQTVASFLEEQVSFMKVH